MSDLVNELLIVEKNIKENNKTDNFPPHPRTLGWFGTACIAMGGSNQSLFLISALLIGQNNIPGQGSAAIPLLVVGLIMSYAATPGWIELTLLFPNRIGGIAATCAEAFQPYSKVLANLAGVCYWWGWVPTCGLSALISASAIQQWYLPWISVPQLATLIVLFFAWVNVRGIHFTSLVTIPIAIISGSLALLSGLIPIFAGTVDWKQATTYHLTVPFAGQFGALTSLMAGLYLIGFAAPAFEQAACHTGEQKDPDKNHPRSIYASALMASVYFVLLPIVWLGVLGPEKLSHDLTTVLGPTFAPLFGIFAKPAAIFFIIFNLFHDTIAPLAGASRTLSQLADDGLLPRAFSIRAPSDAPSFSIVFTAAVSIAFLWMGDPIWLVAAANFCYLIGIGLPNVAVWLLRKDQSEKHRPWLAPKGTIILGVIISAIWGLTTLLGFEQFGLPTVLTGVAFAYSGSILYAWRQISDRIHAGLPALAPTLHVKLTGAMLLVLLLDATGYLIAVANVPTVDEALIAALADIFVAVAILTITIGLILPGMIAHSAVEVSHAARKLTKGTIADFTRAMLALGRGDLENAYARIEINPIRTFSKDEISEMAQCFNELQEAIIRSATGLNDARVGLKQARDKLQVSEYNLRQLNESLEKNVEERTNELQQAQHQLILTARQAGMAEVATNVLHNIGNVLNTVNISSSVLSEKISKSKISRLSDIKNMLETHQNNLAEFITHDPKGIKLVNFISSLADYWKSEQNDLIEELENLSKNINHIKDIVTAQQSISGRSAFQQITAPERILEDALKICGLDQNQSLITIHRDYQKIDPILIDHVKLAQIFINLIRNAKESLLEAETETKNIFLKIKCYDRHTVTIEIIDNGVGIIPENITRIFSHGFTTKKTGHGFGIHSSSLAAKELNGELYAFSEGHNKGATFRLELPYKATSEQKEPLTEKLDSDDN